LLLLVIVVGFQVLAEWIVVLECGWPIGLWCSSFGKFWVMDEWYKPFGILVFGRFD
jgi:hypothetical protein